MHAPPGSVFTCMLSVFERLRLLYIVDRITIYVLEQKPHISEDNEH